MYDKFNSQDNWEDLYDRIMNNMLLSWVHMGFFLFWGVGWGWGWWYLRCSSACIDCLCTASLMRGVMVIRGLTVHPANVKV